MPNTQARKVSSACSAAPGPRRVDCRTAGPTFRRGGGANSLAAWKTSKFMAETTKPAVPRERGAGRSCEGRLARVARGRGARRRVRVRTYRWQRIVAIIFAGARKVAVAVGSSSPRSWPARVEPTDSGRCGPSQRPRAGRRGAAASRVPSVRGAAPKTRGPGGPVARGRGFTSCGRRFAARRRDLRRVDREDSVVRGQCGAVLFVETQATLDEHPRRLTGDVARRRVPESRRRSRRHATEASARGSRRLVLLMIVTKTAPAQAALYGPSALPENAETPQTALQPARKRGRAVRPGESSVDDQGRAYGMPAGAREARAARN